MGLCALALAQLSLGATLASAAESRDKDTATPIKHVIVIIGENRSFDHVFATYVPKSGETVNNLLSEGHRHAGRQQATRFPGPNFDKAQQLAARDTGGTDSFPAESAEAGISRATSCPRRWSAVPTVRLYSQRVRTLARRSPIARRVCSCAQQSESGLPARLLSSIC